MKQFQLEVNFKFRQFSDPLHGFNLNELLLALDHNLNSGHVYLVQESIGRIIRSMMGSGRYTVSGNACKSLIDVQPILQPIQPAPRRSLDVQLSTRLVVENLSPVFFSTFFDSNMYQRLRMIDLCIGRASSRTITRVAAYGSLYQPGLHRKGTSTYRSGTEQPTAVKRAA